MSASGRGRVYVVREGTVRGCGAYLSGPHDCIDVLDSGKIQRRRSYWRHRDQSDVTTYTEATARRIAKKEGGRVVRLVSRAESVERARAAGRAEGLRAAVDAIDDYRIDWAEGTAENVNRVRAVVDAMAAAAKGAL